MMKKQHGPAFRKEMKPIRGCYDCRGRGLRIDMFHEMECATCNASGWVCAETGEALPLADLVLQLNMKLRKTVDELERAKQAQGGAHELYERNNRRGAGGSNYTGD